jgi:hypothetical protein
LARGVLWVMVLCLRILLQNRLSLVDVSAAEAGDAAFLVPGALVVGRDDVGVASAGEAVMTH